MTHVSRWLLMVFTLLLGMQSLINGTTASAGNRQTFLPLVFEKPVTIPTNPALAIFTIENAESGLYVNTLYATTPDGTITHLARHNGDNYQFSPNGNYLVYSHLYGQNEVNNVGFELVDLVAGTHRRLVQTGRGDLKWAPDNLHFAYDFPFSQNNMYVSDVTTDTGHVIANYQHLTFQWLRQAPYLIYNWNDQTHSGLYRAAADGSGISTILTSDSEITLLSVLPDDRILYLETALSDSGDNLFVINSDGTGQVRLTNGPPSAKGDFYVSPQQGLITYSEYYPSTTHSIFYVINAEGEQLSRIQNPCRPEDSCTIRSFAWTPNEDAIYYTLQYDFATRTDLFRAAISAYPVPELVQRGVSGSAIEISPDRRYLAFVIPAPDGQRTLLFRDLLNHTDTAIATGHNLIFRGWRP